MMNEGEIIACELALLQAMKEGNIQVLDELLHDDLLFNSPSGEVVTKATDLDAYWSGKMVVEDIAISEQRIKVYNNTAIVTVIVALKGKFMQQPIDGKFRFMRTWKKFNTQWRVIGGGSVPMP